MQRHKNFLAALAKLSALLLFGASAYGQLIDPNQALLFPSRVVYIGTNTLPFNSTNTTRWGGMSTNGLTNLYIPANLPFNVTNLTIQPAYYDGLTTTNTPVQVTKTSMAGQYTLLTTLQVDRATNSWFFFDWRIGNTGSPTNGLWETSPGRAGYWVQANGTNQASFFTNGFLYGPCWLYLNAIWNTNQTGSITNLSIWQTDPTP